MDTSLELVGLGLRSPTLWAKKTQVHHLSLDFNASDSIRAEIKEEI